MTQAEALLLQIRELDAHISRLLIQIKEWKTIRHPFETRKFTK